MNVLPDSRNYQLRLGSYYEHRGKFDTARKWYSLAAKGGNPEAEFKIGNLAYRSGDYSAAVVHLRKAIAGGVEQFEAVKRLAWSLEKTGHRYLAEDLVEERASHDSSNETEFSRLLESIRARNGQHELKMLRVEKSGSTSGVGNSDRTNEGQPQVSGSDPAWLRANFLSERLEERRGDADWLYNYATVLEEAGRVSDAARIFEEACLNEPSRSWWWYRCGRAHEQSGSVRIARQRYLRAIDQDKKFESRKWGIGVFHHECERWDAAAREFEASAIDAEEVWRRAGLFYRAGHNYLLALDLEEAERCLHQALRLRAGSSKWARMLAITLELRGNYESAARLLELGLPLDDDKSNELQSSLWDLGRVLKLAGKFESSARRLREALSFSNVTVNLEENGTGDEAQETSPSGTPMVDTAEFLFQGSTDRRGHMERARLARRLHELQKHSDSLRKAELLSAENDLELADVYSKILIESGDSERAAEVLLRTRSSWGPHAEKFEQPQKGTYAYQLAAYRNWREGLRIEQDVVLYESNLGLSIDCNPLSLCRYLLANEPGYLHVWVADGEVVIPNDLLESSDVLVVQKDTLQYTRLLATAKFLVNNSTFPTYFTRREGQRYLMTWHGTPFKTLAKDMPEPLVHLNMARNYLQATHAIFPNDHTRRTLIEGMDLDGLISASVMLTGYPRNDNLANLASDKPAKDGTKTVLYAPTWREDSELDSQVTALIKVRKLIEEAGFKPVIRAHHYVESAAMAVDPELNFAPRRIPTNDLLTEVDILITDFSSIFFDFAITGRPILFYTPDWDQYAEKRGLYFSKDDLPGPVCRSLEELQSALKKPEVNEDTRNRFLSKFSPFDDGLATARVANAFFGLHRQPKSTHGESLATLRDGDKGILIRQAFIPNGMTSSFINLVSNLTTRGIPVTILTDGRSVKDEPGRQNTLARVPSEARVVGRIGMLPKSMLEYHASLASARIEGMPSSTLSHILSEMFAFEALRVLPVSGFSSVIEFDGYSEFMARLVLAIGARSESSAIYLHNDILDEIRLRMPELKGVVANLPQFDRVVAVSEGSSRVNAEKLSAEFGISTVNFTYARNSILPEKIRADSQVPLTEDISRFMEGGRLAFVQVGRISPEKNHLFSLDVLAGLREKGIDARLIVVGDGPLRGAVESRVESLGLAEQVNLIGWVDNPYPYIAHADAMLLPSHHEGQPMVILEAQTLGTPVVGSKISSLEAMGVDGPQYLVNLDVTAWADCLDKLQNSESSRKSKFNAEKYVEAVMGEFEAAIGVQLE